MMQASNVFRLESFWLAQRNLRWSAVPEKDRNRMLETGQYVRWAEMVAFGAAVHWADIELMTAKFREHPHHVIALAEHLNVMVRGAETIASIVKVQLEAICDSILQTCGMPEEHRHFRSWLPETLRELSSGEVLWCPVVASTKDTIILDFAPSSAKTAKSSSN